MDLQMDGRYDDVHSVLKIHVSREMCDGSSNIRNL